MKYRTKPTNLYSGSVLSIIHGMHLPLSLDPAQHNAPPTTPLPSMLTGLPLQRGSDACFQLFSCTSDLTQRVSLLHPIWILHATALWLKAANVFISHLLHCLPGCGGEVASRSYRLQLVRLIGDLQNLVRWVLCVALAKRDNHEGIWQWSSKKVGRVALQGIIFSTISMIICHIVKELVRFRNMKWAQNKIIILIS